MHERSLRLSRQPGLTEVPGLRGAGRLPRLAVSNCPFFREGVPTLPVALRYQPRSSRAYGAWGEKKNYGRVYEGLIRSTFVIDEQGVISVAQYNVRATGHVAKLRRDLGIDPK